MYTLRAMSRTLCTSMTATGSKTPDAASVGVRTPAVRSNTSRGVSNANFLGANCAAVNAANPIDVDAARDPSNEGAPRDMLTSASVSFISLARKSPRVIGAPSNNMLNIPSAITSAFDGVLAAVVDAHGDDAKVTTTACLATSSQRAP